MKNQYWIIVGVMFVFGCRSNAQIKPNDSLKELNNPKSPHKSSQKPTIKPYQATKAEKQINAYIKQGYHFVKPSAHATKYPFLNSDKSKLLTIVFKFPEWRTYLSKHKTLEEVVYNNYVRETWRDQRYRENFIVLRIHRKNKEDSKWIIPHNLNKHLYWHLPDGNSSVMMMYTHVRFLFDDNKSKFTIGQMKELYSDFEVEIWNKHKGLLFKKRCTPQYNGKDEDPFTTRNFNCDYRFGVKKQSCISNYERRLQARKNTEARYKNFKIMKRKKKTGK